MTTHVLRNLIKVLEWHIVEAGVSILYIRTDKPEKERIHLVEPIELLQGLASIASIDSYTLSPRTVDINGTVYTYENFLRSYKLSQWEAINLVVKTELEIEESKELVAFETEALLKSLQ